MSGSDAIFDPAMADADVEEMLSEPSENLIPCVSRNGMFAVHSFLAATMALAGARCVIPLDDVILAMRDIGRRMPRALKETSEAGLATTPSGLRFSAVRVDGRESGTDSRPRSNQNS